MEITIQINQDVTDWITQRAINEKCTIEDFATLVLNTVAINSILNQKTIISNEKVQTTP
ncbi:MAG: hypothetical protein [Microvirus sp.]|nr:MAG: hypothetical protein [Microvirus sp.]